MALSSLEISFIIVIVRIPQVLHQAKFCDKIFFGYELLVQLIGRHHILTCDCGESQVKPLRFFQNLQMIEFAAPRISELSNIPAVQTLIRMYLSNYERFNLLSMTARVQLFFFLLQLQSSGLILTPLSTGLRSADDATE